MTMARGSIAGLVRATLAAVATAMLASVLTAFVTARVTPAIRLEMDRDHRAAVTGLYPPERVESRTFAWSGPTLGLALPGTDRSVAWACEAAVINWRPPSAGAARVVVASRGTVLLDTTVTTPDPVLRFAAPPAEGYGLDLRMDISPAFRPGPRDTRALGLAFDWIRCAPAGERAPRPSPRNLVAGAGASAALGVMAGVVGVSTGVAALVSALGAVLLALATHTGIAPYVSGAPPVPQVAWFVALLAAAPVVVADVLTRRRASSWARLAVVVSATACAVKLAFLLHPDKPIVDALFHAHRFESVLAGHFYFTQLSTSATPFPYAIGLYVFAAPFAWLTSDHVLLLRVVVYVCEAAVALLAYVMVSRWWNSGAAGVAAVALLHLVPLPYFVIGNANLTNAFGQSASLAVLGAATLWATDVRRPASVAALTLLVTLALISHVSIVVLLGLTLATLVVVRWWLVGGADRSAVRGLVLAVAAGAALAVVLYWGHFGDLYMAQLRGSPATVTRVAAQPQEAPFRFDGLALIRQAARDSGWPIAVLAAAGGAWLVRTRRRDRLAALVVTQVALWVLFLAAGTLAPIRAGMHQDVWEFLGRVTLATSPSLAMLAAAGAAWCWKAGWPGRLVAVAMSSAAVWPAADALRAWFVR